MLIQRSVGVSDDVMIAQVRALRIVRVNTCFEMRLGSMRRDRSTTSRS
jgi:hypothetical protein